MDDDGGTATSTQHNDECAITAGMTMAATAIIGCNEHSMISIVRGLYLIMPDTSIGILREHVMRLKATVITQAERSINDSLIYVSTLRLCSLVDFSFWWVLTVDERLKTDWSEHDKLGGLQATSSIRK